MLYFYFNSVINMNSLDQLLRQSNILLEVIDELIRLIKEAKDKIDNENFNDREMLVLNNSIKKTLNLSKLFMENYNQFIKDQID